MRKELIISAVVLLATALCGCQNDGHIGSLFGTWALTEMRVNGDVPADFEKGKTTWEFQNNIIRICYELPHMELEARQGTWEKAKDGGKEWLVLDFTHYEDGMAPGTNIYGAPAWLGFPKNEKIRLEYAKDSSREMVLSRISDAGATYVYTLKKTW